VNTPESGVEKIKRKKDQNNSDFLKKTRKEKSHLHIRRTKGE